MADTKIKLPLPAPHHMGKSAYTTRPDPAYYTADLMRAYAATDNKVLLDEIERLTQELANARAVDIHSCHAGCTRAGCVNARLREDAERYRWLTSGEHGSKRDDWIWDCVLTEDQRKGHNDIDAAIDAARKAAPS